MSARVCVCLFMSTQALQESAARAVLDAAKKAAGQGQLLDKKQLKAIADQVQINYSCCLHRHKST